MACFGAHVSVAGGLERAFSRAESLGCEAAQIFVKNASRWQAKPLETSTVEKFGAARSASTVGPLFAHAAYLINLCSPKPEVRTRSVEALVDELTRCRRLDLDGLVFHPGAHLGVGEEQGLRSIAEAMQEVLRRTPDGRSKLLLETTAGQGTVLGYRLEQLESIVEALGSPPDVGICLDTCHLLAAGYPVDEPEGAVAVLDEVVSRFGLDRLGAIHLNDSRHPRGSRKDRHENLGEGYIGLEPLVPWVHDPRLSSKTLILETPAGEEEAGHRRDLGRLREIRGREPSPAARGLQ